MSHTDTPILVKGAYNTVGKSYLNRKVVAMLNGKILTIDSEDRITEGVLIADDRIVMAGTNEQILQLAPADAKLVDLGGRTVVPGFIDGHAHMELAVNHLENGFNLFAPPIETMEQLLNALKERVDQTPKGEWVTARSSLGLYKKLKEKRLPTRHDLDKVARENPVAVFSGLHIASLNTLALETMGWMDEENMPRASTFARDPETGDFTGALTEVQQYIPGIAFGCKWGHEEFMASLLEGPVKRWVSRGCTTVHELPRSTEGVQAWQQIHREGKLPMRLRLYFTHPRIIDLDEFLRVGFQPGFGDDWLRIGGIKIFADGIGLDANIQERDDRKWTQEELDDLIYKSHAAGHQIWTHVTTPLGVETALNSYERALKRLPRSDHRHRLEHAADHVTDEGLLDRMARAGLVPICTPQFIYSGGYNEIGVYNFRSLMKRGFILPGNSDTTGTQPEAADPWHGIWCCVKRERFDGELLDPAEALTPLEAIRMFTLWAAWGGFEEKEKGSIEPGKLADLAVLGEDPLRVEPDALRTMPVELVLIGGEPRWSSPAFEGCLE